MIFIGDDWAEAHHDVYLMDDAGKRLASRRLPEGLAGIRELHELIGEHVQEPNQVVIGIETDRGLWVDALSAAGYQVYAINPLAVAHSRSCSAFSIAYSTSPSLSETANTAMPASPSIAVALLCSITWGLSVRVPNTTNHEAPGPFPSSGNQPCHPTTTTLHHEEPENTSNLAKLIWRNSTRER